MKKIVYAQEPESAWSILNRPYEAASEELASVEAILNDVEKAGDTALIKYCEKFDKVRFTSADQLKVKAQEIDSAYKAVTDEFIDSIRVARDNISDFHRRQIKESWFTTSENGIVLGHRYVPIERVGVYVPGGTAPLASSLLMSVVPAMVAGVSEIVLVTPPQPDGTVSPYILVAAGECGVSEIYKVGGPWAIGALAYGTDTIAKVDKIVGPGNIYVSLAKKVVYGRVGIDGLYGPSEIVVIGDESTVPKYAAADLLSQAEHGPTSAAIFITPCAEIADAVAAEADKQLELLSRSDIARRALDDCGAVIVVSSLDEAFELANGCAPEHLELLVKDPWAWLSKVKHAGAVFLGRYSTEPIGDYVAGTNHSLPTNGTAKFSSGLSVDDFVKKHSVVSYTLAGLEKFGPHGMVLAEVEGLTAHKNSIGIRLREEANADGANCQN